MEGQQHGPISSKLLVHKLKEGDIDGLTLVYGGEAPLEWKKVSEVQVLKDEMAKIAVEEEQARLAFLKSTEDDDIQQQVFVEDAIPEFPVHEMQTAGASSGASKAAMAAGAQEGEVDENGQRIFVADNGQKYMWDEEENDWIEAEEDDEEDNQESERLPIVKASANHSNKTGAGGGGAGIKRKAGDAANGGSTKNAAVAASTAEKSVNSDDEMEDEEEESKISAAEENTANAKPKKKRSKKKAKKGPNTWVYVTGLPPDVSAEEIKDHFSKVKRFLWM